MATRQSRIRILVVDDYDLVRDGLAAMLSGEPDLEVVDQAEDGAEALEKVARCRPDVVLMDVSMPGLDGVEATRRIRERFPDVEVIGLSMHEQSQTGEQMVAAGATDYLNKGGPSEQLLAAIRKLAPR